MTKSLTKSNLSGEVYSAGASGESVVPRKTQQAAGMACSFGDRILLSFGEIRKWGGVDGGNAGTKLTVWLSPFPVVDFFFHSGTPARGMMPFTFKMNLLFC